MSSWPVRVRAGAFGAGACGGMLPERDLYLSPGHPILGESEKAEVLVPIMCLIKGTSIARAPRDQVTYWYVELDAYDILLAEACLPRASSTTAIAAGSTMPPTSQCSIPTMRRRALLNAAVGWRWTGRR